ncbi:hypothetical protein KIW84_022677 [Lathyrus oleraceus]|uniref:Retrovirus-related Pol polyprotein from transposon TNT 1-94-like beta-barrel domain-containing protein n=1 Tax=Pisum sativum TaxID=3888 RepID=A0A9D5BB08_PEA|nr:hypothetical protein KIW84_022677 [Pisum sativum]
MIANTGSAPSSSWFPDSGTSFHVTNASQNIQQSTPFEGPDHIFIGNGQGLHIHSSGSSFFPSQSQPNTSLALHNLLHVPSITKNLISVRYSTTHKGYKCLSPSGRMFISKDVLFNKSKFPYHDLFLSTQSSSSTSIPSSSSSTVTLNTPVLPTGPPPTEVSMASSSSSSYSSPGNNSDSPVSSPSAPTGHVSTPSPPSMINSPSNASSSPSSSSISTPRDPSLQPLPTNSHPMITRTKSGVPLPHLNPSIFLLHSEPKSVKVAFQDPKWFC